AVDGGSLALHDAGDLLLLRPFAGAAAHDAGAAAQAADVGDAPGARAARLDAAQLIVAARHADAADALERRLLVAIDVALAHHVGDRALAVSLGAEQLEEAGRLHLLGEARAPLGVGLGLLLGELGLLGLGELVLGGRLLLLLALLLVGLLLLFLLRLGDLL